LETVLLELRLWKNSTTARGQIKDARVQKNVTGSNNRKSPANPGANPHPNTHSETDRCRQKKGPVIEITGPTALGGETVFSEKLNTTSLLHAACQLRFAANRLVNQNVSGNLGFFAVFWPAPAQGSRCGKTPIHAPI
jgi:hypothetical protein